MLQTLSGGPSDTPSDIQGGPSDHASDTFGGPFGHSLGHSGGVWGVRGVSGQCPDTVRQKELKRKKEEGRAAQRCRTGRPCFDDFR